jgi:prostaglandin-endoperoxide synthase 2
MRTTIIGALVVTAVEAPAVYGFLRLEDKHFWLAVVCLATGEMLETTIAGADVRRRLRQRYDFGDRPHEPGSAEHHRRRLRNVLLAMSFAEILLWIAWVRLEEEFGVAAGAAFLVVLMHLKHQAETAAVRGVVYSTGLVSWRVTVANLLEAGGAIWALWLLERGHEVESAAALVAGLALEHVILVNLLLREIEQRNIELPRLPPGRRPRSDLAMRLAEFWGENFPWWWRFVHWLRPLRVFFNRLSIDQLIRRGPLRPEPLSTMAPYTSWASLTDKSWSGRHLGPVEGDPDHPDVELVAELFTREGEMTPCPKSTLLFTCFAQWFVDSFLRTERRDPETGKRNALRSESPHQVNLNTLYGLTDEMTKQLRTSEGGRLRSQPINGEDYPEYLCAWRQPKEEFNKLLRPIGFNDLNSGRDHLFAMGSDVRTVGFVAFNVLFLREHNRIADLLESRYPNWDNERLFGTARMILIMVLIKIVVNEYINHINAYYFRFDLMAKKFQRAPWQRPNWMSIEFNLLYRWHSLVPPTLNFGGQRLTPERSLTATRQLTQTGLGAFMEAMSCQPAGRISLFNTDPYLVEVAEKPSIQQARAAELRSYNDYRERFRFPRVTRFDQFSSSIRVQEGLRRVYGRVENVELFAGLFAEEGGPNAVLPPLMTVMVAYDAFSQLLTNPLVAPRIYNDKTFSEVGLNVLHDTNSISDLVHRNARERHYHISLSRHDYVRV